MTKIVRIIVTHFILSFYRYAVGLLYRMSQFREHDRCDFRRRFLFQSTFRLYFFFFFLFFLFEAEGLEPLCLTQSACTLTPEDTRPSNVSRCGEEASEFNFASFFF